MLANPLKSDSGIIKVVGKLVLLLLARKASTIFAQKTDRKSTRLNSSHTEIYTLSLHDALPIYACQPVEIGLGDNKGRWETRPVIIGAESFNDFRAKNRSEEHTSELQSHRDLHSFPTRRSSDLCLPTR